MFRQKGDLYPTTASTQRGNEALRERQGLRQENTCTPEEGVPSSRVHVVAPVPEISPAGQASHGGAPVLLKELLAHRPFPWIQAMRSANTIDGVQAMSSRSRSRDGSGPGTICRRSIISFIVPRQFTSSVPLVLLRIMGDPLCLFDQFSLLQLLISTTPSSSLSDRFSGSCRH